MKRLSVVLVAGAMALGWAVPCVSQEAAAQPAAPASGPVITAGGYLSVGGWLGDLGKFNRSIESRGFTGVKDYAYELGLGTYHIYRHLLVGIELKGTGWRPTEGGNSVTELYGVNGLLNIGFNVLPTTRYLLYPYVSGGTGQLFLRLRQDRVGFDQALAALPVDRMLNQRTAMLQAGLGFDANLPRRSAGPGKFRTVGVRVGYAWDPGKASDWELHDVNVRGGPSASMTGLYGQVVFGKSKLVTLKRYRDKKECTAKEQS